MNNMITKLEKPTWMTAKEADKKYYPDSYIMVNCKIEEGNIVSGEVVAYAPMKNNGGQLGNYKRELTLAGKYGVVFIMQTKDPLDGGSLLVEYCEAN